MVGLWQMVSAQSSGINDKKVLVCHTVHYSLVVQYIKSAASATILTTRNAIIMAIWHCGCYSTNVNYGPP